MDDHEHIRSLRSFSAAMLIAGFGLNWLWEMLQGPAYVELPRLPWRERLIVCTIAALGDAAITLGIYGIGALAAGRLRWGMSGGWNVYATGALLGAATAVAIEWKALAFDLWSYNEHMPIAPFAEVGLWPFLQLTLLVPASFWIAVWWSRQTNSEA